MSKKIRVFIISLLSILGYQTLLAQEVKTPLLRNIQLKNEGLKEGVINAAKKAGVNFPYVDYFLNNGKPDLNLWEDGGVDISGRKVVFNAVNILGNVYTDTLQPIDMLSSRQFDLSSVVLPVFITFTISSGNTFMGGDSLVFEGKDIYGTWQPLWRNYGLALSNQEVLVLLNKSMFVSGDFEMRWKAYSSNLNLSNTHTFLLSKVVLSQQLPFPFYEDIKLFSSTDSIGQMLFFNSPDIHIALGSSVGYPWGNCLKLDVFDSKKQVYQNANGLYGGADTLYLNPFDVFQFDLNDSIFFSFACKGINNLLAGDSLIVEFKNNLGNWVRSFAIPGSSGTFFTPYTFNVNKGRNRHSFFQVRFINKTSYIISNNATWLLSSFRYTRKIEMPLIDDFSGSRIRVNPLKWADSYVFVNNDFPVNQPSLNVATFDGLDQYGNAYSQFPLKGTSDKLTSQPFNLQKYAKKDSIMLSFYYQYQPQGDIVMQSFPDDSLILELRSSRFAKDSFDVVWMIGGNDSLFNIFRKYTYVLVNPKYFHDDFQFRFKNHGSLTGNISQWHLDYVRFGEGRKIDDVIKDIALTNTPAIRLGKYNSMPWNQFKANKAAYSSGQDSLRFVNHDAQNYAVDYFRNVFKPEGDTLDKFNNILPTLYNRNDSTVFYNKSFVFDSGLTGDSLLFHTQYRLKISGGQNDNIPQNDSFRVPTIFSNYFAYDDGTAEGGYGVRLKTNVGVSLKYFLEVPDSLYGVYVFFNQSEYNVSTQRFYLKVWSQISPLSLPANSDKVIYSQEVSKPVYTNAINGFAAFKFTQPIAVKDSFYIGWEQTAAYLLNVGLDNNYPIGVNPNMAYKTDGRWYASEIPGALMMRPIVGKFFNLPASIEQTGQFNKPLITVYPNPAKHEINIDLDQAEQYESALYDLTGRKIIDLDFHKGETKLPNLPDGFYILVFQHKLTQLKIAKKLLINQND